MTVCICIGPDKSCSNECSSSLISNDGVNFSFHEGSYLENSDNLSNRQSEKVAKQKLMDELGFRVDDSMNISTQFLYDLKREKDERDKQRAELNALNEYLRINFYEISTLAVMKAFSFGVIKSSLESLLKNGFNGLKLAKEGIKGGINGGNKKILEEQVYAKFAREAKCKAVQKEMINFMRQLDVEIDSHIKRTEKLKRMNY